MVKVKPGMIFHLLWVYAFRRQNRAENWGAMPLKPIDWAGVFNSGLQAFGTLTSVPAQNGADGVNTPSGSVRQDRGRAHWTGIVHVVESRLSNGILEGINHKVQLAKRRARGFRNIDNFSNMIDFLCGKLKCDYSRYFT